MQRWEGPHTRKVWQTRTNRWATWRPDRTNPGTRVSASGTASGVRYVKPPFNDAGQRALPGVAEDGAHQNGLFGAQFG